MRKNVFLSILAIILVVGIAGSAWYMTDKISKERSSRDAFIPYNSAMVLNFNTGMSIPERIGNFLKKPRERFKTQFISQIGDSLIAQGFAKRDPQTIALRTEGKELVFLYVLEDVESTTESSVHDYLKTIFAHYSFQSKKYEHFDIYSIISQKQEVYVAMDAGMILLSDSEIYLEDALRQSEIEQTASDKREMKNVNKYFSNFAGFNVFLNADFFSEVLPSYFQTKSLYKHLDLSKCFNWAAMDGDMDEQGATFSGFMSYGQVSESYIKTVEGQHPISPEIENVIPIGNRSYLILALSDIDQYLLSLENYRHDVGQTNLIREYRQDIAKKIGREAESELLKLVQGEFAQINMNFDGSGKSEGAVFVSLKSGSLCQNWIEDIVNSNARFTNTHPDSYRFTYKPDSNTEQAFYKFPCENLASILFGDIFEGIPNRYAYIQDNYLILASSERVVEHIMKTFMRQNFVTNSEWYKSIRNNISTRYNLGYFADMTKEMTAFRFHASDSMRTFIDNNEHIGLLSNLICQWSNENDMIYSSIYAATNTSSHEESMLLWKTKLDALMEMKPTIVKNHVTNEREIFVQDVNGMIYLINDAGRILWKQQIEGKINSPVTQVDAFKNNKLQLLFSTEEKIYLIDRNGNPVGRFPMQLPAYSTHGITVCDYDNTKDYRIFAPCNDRKVYLYDIEGKQITGWNTPQADKTIVSPIRYYKIGDKDYIIFADRVRLYILDRRGNERVNISSVFELSNNPGLYLTRQGSKRNLVFANAEGLVHVVDFSGKVETIKCDSIVPGWHLNVGDVNCDNADELIFSSNGALVVYDLGGREIYHQKWGEDDIDFPYLYRFSAKDARLGLVDKKESSMMMLSLEGGLSAGFPMSGNSPFTIISEGAAFSLYAGANEGSLIKYRVKL